MLNLHGLEFESEKAEFKPCGLKGCSDIIPICFAHISQICCGSRYTNRWHHVTIGEHYCNDCFEALARSRLPRGEWIKDLKIWKVRWLRRICDLVDPTIRDFLVNQVMPHWARCKQCQVWRQLPRSLQLTPDFLINFSCSDLNKKRTLSGTSNACDIAEDVRVDMVRESPEDFMSAIRYLVLLENSAAEQFLLPYPMDRVGIAPTAQELDAFHISNESDAVFDGDVFNEDIPSHLAENPPRPKGVPVYFNPFLMPNENGKAISFEPDKPQLVEMTDFPEFDRHPDLYLGIRNLLLAIWYRNPKIWLTTERAACFISVRGLIRIALVEHCLPAMINCFTCKGYINYGLLKNPPEEGLLPPLFNREQVVVVGAGISGLATARQLANFGTKVTVLEASNKLGGRISDFALPGSNPPLLIPDGASVINGCVNSPIVLLAHQAGLKLTPDSTNCVLIGPNSQPIDNELEKRMDFHVEAILNRMACEKRAVGPGDLDVSQTDKTMQIVFDEAESFVLPDLRDLEGNVLESSLVEFNLAELDLSLGGGCKPLTVLPWSSWDCHQPRAEFPGVSLTPLHGEGLSPLVSALAEGLDIKLQDPVVEVNFTEDKVTVTTEKKAVFTCTKLVMAVTPSSLASIDFTPELPRHLIQELPPLPYFVITLGFESKFWTAMSGPDGRPLQHFAGLPVSRNQRGFCHSFKDVFPERSDVAVLQTQIFGEASSDWTNSLDDDIVMGCVCLLESIFSSDEICVGPLVWSRVKKWADAYTCQPLVSVLQPHLADKVCFVGESFSYEHPMSMAGAYLTGVFEAGRIADGSANIEVD